MFPETGSYIEKNITSDGYRITSLHDFQYTGGSGRHTEKKSAHGPNDNATIISGSYPAHIRIQDG